jgi:DNA-directed RNA polymerase subunit F
MVSPEFIEEKAVTLVETKEVLAKISERDEELNYLTNKTREFLDSCDILPKNKHKELKKKLKGLELTRLKHEHIVKIVDFLPVTIEELKIVLQAYPLSMPKKDQEAIISTVKETVS